MFVHRKMGLGNGLTEQSTSIRELTNAELNMIAGGESDSCTIDPETGECNPTDSDG